MTQAEQILEAASSVLMVDWPSRDVPDALALAGFDVVVKGGPEPDNYSAQEVRDGGVVPRPIGHPPEHADIVYSHRPIGELPAIVALAEKVGASTIWCQSGLAGSGIDDPKGCWVPEEKSLEARRIVESAGMTYVDDTYIADAARQLQTRT